MKSIFDAEIKNVTKRLKDLNQDGSLCFALVTDSHLSDTFDETCENIKCVDEKAGFYSLVHLGDFLCGNIPQKASYLLLNEELNKCCKSIKTNRTYVARGNHDGHRDETYLGQNVCDISLDENWYESASKYMPNNLNYNKKSPYFFVDIEDKKVRFIVLSSCFYEIDKDKKIFKKDFGFSDEQYEWFCNVALDLPENYTVILFSHAVPIAKLDMPSDSSKITENHGMDIVNALNNAKKEKNINVACWCFGHCHGDVTVKYEDIWFISTASQVAYIPQLWTVTNGSFPENRDLGTVNQDAWDSVVLNTKHKIVDFIRFGAGEDRQISY